MDNKTKIFVAFPPVFIIILVVAAYMIPFKRGLTASESEILNFMPSELKIATQQIVHTYRDILGPFDFSSNDTTDDHRDGAEMNEPVYELSLVVISGSRKMAILRGKVVREGDRVDGITVAKIEADRVLLGDKHMKWVYLGEAQ